MKLEDIVPDDRRTKDAVWRNYQEDKLPPPPEEGTIAKNMTSVNMGYKLEGGEQFEGCEFIRVLFTGPAEHVSFSNCTFRHSIFESPLVDSAVSGCTFQRTHLPIKGASMVCHNHFDGYSKIRDMPPDLPDLTLLQRFGRVLRKIPLLGWILRRLGILQLPYVPGAIISGNRLAAREKPCNS